MQSSPNPSRGTLLVVSEQPADDQALWEALKRRQYAICLSRLDTFTTDLLVSVDLLILSLDSFHSPGVAIGRHVKALDVPVFVPVILLVTPEAGRRGRDPALLDRLMTETGADSAIWRSPRPAELLRQVETLLRFRQRMSNLYVENRALRQSLGEQAAAYDQLVFQSRQLSVLRESIVNNVAHELRTPMLQVKSAVALLDGEVRAAPALNGMVRMMEYATQATTRLENVIQNISQLATLLSLKPEPFWVQDAVSLAMRLLARSWPASPEVPRVRIHLEDVPPVMGDKNGIGLVLKELIANALKFSPDGSPVDVRAQQVADGVELTVQDYGIGLDADQIDHIFQAFYQVDHGSTRRYGGVGTGLAIVKLVLDEMGVSIGVQSALNEGSIFGFVLPLAALD
jgi:signal transduction histidine kinase